MSCLVWRYREGPIRQKQRWSDGPTSWRTLRIFSSYTDIGKDREQLSLRSPQRNQPHEPLNLGLLDTWPKRKLLFAVLKPPCLCLLAIAALDDGLRDWKQWRRWHQHEVWAGAKTPWLPLWLAEHTEFAFEAPEGPKGTACGQDSEPSGQTPSVHRPTFPFREMSLLYRKEFRNMIRECEVNC